MNTLSSADDVLASAYAEKDASYYECPRPEMLAFVPADARRVLDVGCGTGAFSAAVRRRNKCEVWGVEPTLESVLKARETLDEVYHGLFDPSLELPGNHFDCIIFNDVLEHMFDPLGALTLSATLLRPNGVIVASIPNIGHFPTMWRLIMEGEWEYKERGILDKTHLRFFTRKSIVRLFESGGYRMKRMEGVNERLTVEPDDRRLWRRYRAVSWLPIKSVHDMRFLQFGVVAELTKQPRL